MLLGLILCVKVWAQNAFHGWFMSPLKICFLMKFWQTLNKISITNSSVIIPFMPVRSCSFTLTKHLPKAKSTSSQGWAAHHGERTPWKLTAFCTYVKLCIQRVCMGEVKSAIVLPKYIKLRIAVFSYRVIAGLLRQNMKSVTFGAGST